MARLTEQLGYLDQHRLSTEKAREAYRQQFDIGQRTLLDLLDTQNEYFEAGRAYTNAYYNQFVAQARTLSSMGKLVLALNAAYENVQAAKLGVETRKAAYMPRVDFRVRQSWDRNLDGVKGGSRDAAVELLLNYNLYRGGADKAREV